MRNKFTFWHSLMSMLGIAALEAIAITLTKGSGWEVWILVLGAAIGSTVNLYVATEVIEEVRNARHMFALLSAVLGEFLIFFALQYAFMLTIDPTSFPTLNLNPVTLLLHSTMVFVFNPLYLPGTLAGQAMLLINSLASVGLVVFILQNLSQLRRLVG